MPTGVYPRTEYHKDKMKQLWQNPEYRKHMSEVHKGKIGYWKGKERPYSPWNKNKKFPQISGGKHWNWKNGESIGNGYIYILKKEHPFCNRRGYVKRSHLVMEKHLGRYLTPKEVVHHKGIKYPIGSVENKQDDRPENLELFANDSKHQRLHFELRKKNKFGQLI